MAHYGTLRNYKFSDDDDDIRGSELFGRDDKKLGNLIDVIFDHSSGDIRYVVVDTGGWLRSKEFLIPVSQLELRNAYDVAEKHYRANLTNEQVERFPEYDEKMLSTEEGWQAYEQRYGESRGEAWSDGPVLHQPDSMNIVAPVDVSAGPAPGMRDVRAERTPADRSAYERRTRHFTIERANPNSMNTSPMAWEQNMGNVTLHHEREDRQSQNGGVSGETATSEAATNSASPEVSRTIEGDSIFNDEDIRRLRSERAGVGGSGVDRSAPVAAGASRDGSTGIGAHVGRRWSSFQGRLRAERHAVIQHCGACQEGHPVKKVDPFKKDVA